MTDIVPFEFDTLYIGGSHAYGLATQESDTDYRGFYVRSAHDILMSVPDESRRVTGGDDAQLYSVDKFVRMLADGNPNIVEFLGINDFEELGTAGKLILEHRDYFIARSVYRPFKGFATQQNRHLGGGGRLDAAKIAKAQCHYVRLCRMGAEMLTDDVVNTDRTGIDAPELLEIKRGRYVTGDEPSRGWAKLAESEMRRLDDAYERSKLPEMVNPGVVDHIVMTVNLARVSESMK